jgi:hypothetical protein
LIRRLLKKSPLTLAVLAAVLAATSGSASAAQTTGQVIVGSGSDTTVFMMTALGDLYNQAPGCNPLKSPQPLNFSCPNSASENQADFVNYFHDLTAERYQLGSSNGINQICAVPKITNVQFARSSRVPLGAGSGGSDCSGLQFVGYARDGISWECFTDSNGTANPCSGVNSISTLQLQEIYRNTAPYNCSITDWGQLTGGSAGAIDMYVPQANSGTGITWASFLGVNLTAGQTLNGCVPPAHNLGAGVAGSFITPENTNSLIHTNGDEANAIMPYSVGVFRSQYGGLTSAHDADTDGTNNFTVALGQINGQTPTPANILSGSFTFSRYLWNVYCKGVTVNGALHCGGATGTGPAQVWTTNFVGAQGFLCKGEAKFNDSHGNPILDPRTGNPYRSAPDGSGNPQGEIADTISANGFVPLKKFANGTYCTTAHT